MSTGDMILAGLVLLLPIVALVYVLGVLLDAIAAMLAGLGS